MRLSVEDLSVVDALNDRFGRREDRGTVPDRAPDDFGPSVEVAQRVSGGTLTNPNKAWEIEARQRPSWIVVRLVRHRLSWGWSLEERVSPHRRSSRRRHNFDLLNEILLIDDDHLVELVVGFVLSGSSVGIVN